MLAFNKSTTLSNNSDYLQNIEPMQLEKLEIVSIVINILNFSVCLWILFALLKLSNYKSNQRKQKYYKHDKSCLTNYICFVPIFPSLRVIATQCTMVVKWYPYEKNGIACQYLNKISIVFMFVSLTMIFIFPWLRQLHLYQQPTLKRLNTKLVKALSVALLIELIVGAIVVGSLYFFNSNFKQDLETMECVKLNYELDPTLKIIYCIAVVGFLVYQVSLFALLMYPLIKHIRKGGSEQNSQTKKKITSMLKHAVVCVVILTCVPLLASILENSSSFTEKLPLYLQHSLIDTELNILLFSVVISFENWKGILTFSYPPQASITRASTVTRGSSIRQSFKVSTSSNNNSSQNKQ